MRSFDTAIDSLDTIHAALTARNTAREAEIESVVREILTTVRTRGDAAVLDYTRRFDWPEAGELEAPRSELVAVRDQVSDEQAAIISGAAENITEFHRAERGHLQSWMHFSRSGPARMLGQTLNPVQRVGVYVPGGKAAYPSTVLMTTIPARVAGVAEIILCSPPDENGKLPPLVATAAAKHADRVFKVGGAQAIAAMAYGTETIPKCNIIVGPGNAYVNVAKRLIYGEAGIDMLAGPSEIAIVADDGANPAFIAADLLAQTEHGPDNRGVVFASSARIIEKCQNEIARQRATLSRREILERTGENLIFVKTNSIEESLALSNILAPEHLELMVREPLAALPLVRNAGAVLLGDYTSAPIGDYWAGPSHTLPTAGAARFSNPLSVATFMKRTNVIYYSREAAEAAAEPVARFANAEGFDAHADAALMRSRSPSLEERGLGGEVGLSGHSGEVS